MKRKLSYRFSIRIFNADGSSFPVAAFEEETVRNLVKHAIATGHVKAVVSERVGHTNEWRRVYSVSRSYEIS